MDSIKFSVILPVYNLEKYLRECLDSIKNQSLKEFEVICINDGSTDNSLEILKEYAKSDLRFKVIDQQNQGVSVARNRGIELARGKYIAFIDGDDNFELNALEVCYNSIEKKDVDILIFCANLFINDEFVSQINVDFINKVIMKRNSFDDFINLNIVVWDKIFRTKFLKEKGLKFPEGLRVSEDGIFCMDAFFCGARYDYINEKLYNHKDFVLNSATSNVNYAIKEDLRALNYLFNTQSYQAQALDVQLAIINKFCGGALFYWSRLNEENYREMYYQDMMSLRSYLQEHYNIRDLKRLKNYKKLQKRIMQYENKFPYNLYCKIKFRNYKLVRVLGFERKIYN